MPHDRLVINYEKITILVHNPLALFLLAFCSHLVIRRMDTV